MERDDIDAALKKIRAAVIKGAKSTRATRLKGCFKRYEIPCVGATTPDTPVAGVDEEIAVSASILREGSMGQKRLERRRKAMTKDIAHTSGGPGAGFSLGSAEPYGQRHKYAYTPVGSPKGPRGYAVTKGGEKIAGAHPRGKEMTTAWHKWAHKTDTGQERLKSRSHFYRRNVEKAQGGEAAPTARKSLRRERAIEKRRVQKGTKKCPPSGFIFGRKCEDVEPKKSGPTESISGVDLFAEQHDDIGFAQAMMEDRIGDLRTEHLTEATVKESDPRHKRIVAALLKFAGWTPQSGPYHALWKVTKVTEDPKDGTYSGLVWQRKVKPPKAGKSSIRPSFTKFEKMWFTIPASTVEDCEIH